MRRRHLRAATRSHGPFQSVCLCPRATFRRWWKLNARVRPHSNVHRHVPAINLLRKSTQVSHAHAVEAGFEQEGILPRSHTRRIAPRAAPAPITSKGGAAQDQKQAPAFVCASLRPGRVLCTDELLEGAASSRRQVLDQKAVCALEGAPAGQDPTQAVCIGHSTSAPCHRPRCCLTGR